MPLAQIAWMQGLGYHQYADDPQLYLLLDGWSAFRPEDLDLALQAAVWWLRLSQLKLNPMKMEFLYLSHQDLCFAGPAKL